MIANPRNLFLIDGAGAIVSAIMLGLVLVQLEELIGMPTSALYVLATVPCFFVVYSVGCFFLTGSNWQPWMKGIAIANLLYCVLSTGYLWQHFQQLTVLGLVYFVVELIIVSGIAMLEYRIASSSWN